MKILVVGEGCRDIFNYGVCNRLCPEAPVPVFNSITTTENGGMAINVQQNLLKLGVDVELLTNTNWKDITKTRFIDQRANHMFMRLDCNDNKYGKKNDKIKIRNINYDRYDAIIISDYDKGFLSEEDIIFIAANHKLVFLDTKKILGDWCRDVKYIKINNYEYERTKHKIGTKVKKKLIITLGPEGAKYNNIIYPVPQVEIKDASGAGDTFVAALTVKYVATKDVGESIIFANECATQVVQKRGVNTLEKETAK